MFTVPCPECKGESCEVCGGTGEIKVEEKPFSRDGKRWDKLEDHIMELLYKEFSYKQLGRLLGRSEASVRNRCYEKGWRKQAEDWTPLEVQELVDWYASHDTGRGELKLDDLAKKLGRLPSNVCRKARELGLTDSSRPMAESLLAAYREIWKGLWETRTHPKGMLGKKHTEVAKKQMSASQKVAQNSIPAEEKTARAKKAVATKIEKYGTASKVTENTFSRCRRGRREDLGSYFFRSSWEANYARYLNLLREQGKIEKWEYEVDTFVFHGEVRGAITYLPDFKVWFTAEKYEYHEVKGWMDGKSKTKLKRMAKHYPNEVVKVVGEAEYHLIEKTYSYLIPLWEGK